jgi:hypothetical protein
VLSAAAVVAIAGAVAQASTAYDANLTTPPGVYFGTGNSNGAFTVATDNGIEIGLRAKQRQGSLIHSSTDVYTVQPGPQASSPSHAWWNYEFSIKVDAGTLSDYTALLTITDPNGHTAAVNPLTYWADNEGWSSAFGADNPAVLTTDTVAQNSENPKFGDFPLASFYSMYTPGDYTFALDVTNIQSGAGASDTIIARVVPLPAAVWGGLVLLGAMGGAELLRRRRLA